MSEDTSSNRALPKLEVIAGGMGIEIPGSRLAPIIDAGKPIRALALEVGSLIAGQLIFKRGGQVVTIDEQDGSPKPMGPSRFCGWIEEFAAIKNPERGRDSFNKETASLIMAQDIFLERLRPIAAIHPVRLPVCRASGEVELLPPGYDRESQIYTVDTLPYRHDVTLGEALGFLGDVFAEYPWLEFGGDLLGNRSASIQVLTLLGVFCRAMFPAGTPRPMLAWIGNQPNTGKSMLAAMPLLLVFGNAASTDFPERKEELEKTLHTKAQTMAPYILFDDVGNGIYSNSLNRFLTASRHTGRVMGSNTEEFDVPNVTQIFVTGNAIKLTPDLMRRALVVELFLAGEARGRVFKRRITAKWLLEPGVRAQFLGALWALVRHWNESAKLLHHGPLASFEEWTEKMGGMMLAAGFADPLTPPMMPMGGDQESLDWNKLLIELADAADGKSIEYTREQIVETAREIGVLEDLVGSTSDGSLNSNDNKRFGRRLAVWRGREMLDSEGRKFKFGWHRTKKGKLYPCVFLPAEGPQNDAVTGGADADDATSPHDPQCAEEEEP